MARKCVCMWWKEISSNFYENVVVWCFQINYNNILVMAQEVMSKIINDVLNLDLYNIMITFCLNNCVVITVEHIYLY